MISNYNTQEKFKRLLEIQRLLCSGLSPSDLVDERVFSNPYSNDEVWSAIEKLNSGVRNRYLKNID